MLNMGVRLIHACKLYSNKYGILNECHYFCPENNLIWSKARLYMPYKNLVSSQKGFKNLEFLVCVHQCLQLFLVLIISVSDIKNFLNVCI